MKSLIFYVLACKIKLNNTCRLFHLSKDLSIIDMREIRDSVSHESIPDPLLQKSHEIYEMYNTRSDSVMNLQGEDCVHSCSFCIPMLLCLESRTER